MLFKSHLIPNISAQPATTIASATSNSTSAVTPFLIKSQSLYLTILSLQQNQLLAFFHFFSGKSILPPPVLLLPVNHPMLLLTSYCFFFALFFFLKKFVCSDNSYCNKILLLRFSSSSFLFYYSPLRRFFLTFQFLSVASVCARSASSSPLAQC